MECTESVDYFEIHVYVYVCIYIFFCYLFLFIFIVIYTIQCVVYFNSFSHLIFSLGSFLCFLVSISCCYISSASNLSQKSRLVLIFLLLTRFCTYHAVFLLKWLYFSNILSNILVCKLIFLQEYPLLSWALGWRKTTCQCMLVPVSCGQEAPGSRGTTGHHSSPAQQPHRPREHPLLHQQPEEMLVSCNTPLKGAEQEWTGKNHPGHLVPLIFLSTSIGIGLLCPNLCFRKKYRRMFFNLEVQKQDKM